jgi:hydroxyethylthiazole kinase
MIESSQIIEARANLREKSPLIHNITNWVVTNLTANVILCVGASPVMAHAREEVAQMASYAGALVLNIGTLTSELIEAMIIAGKSANDHGVPVLLDPVGAGATAMRTDSCLRILDEVDVSIIRGNAAEVMAIIGEEAEIRGVDSLTDSESAENAAKKLAVKRSATVAVTGKTDIITDGDRTYRASNGHPLLGRVTGTGCSATATIGCFASVIEDRTQAAACALSYFGMAGEKAAAKHSAPGSFAVSLLDSLYDLSDAEIKEMAKIETT